MAFAPIGLLILSNIFMNFAWYGHLKFKTSPLLIAITAIWGIAFMEYCLAVPANRIGLGYFSVSQLKIMQEVIILGVFAVFSMFFLKKISAGTIFLRHCACPALYFLCFDRVE